MPGNVGFWVLAFIVHWVVAAQFFSLREGLNRHRHGDCHLSVYSVSSSAKKIDISLESGLNLSQVPNYGHILLLFSPHVFYFVLCPGPTQAL